MVTTLDGMVTYLEGLLSIKSHGSKSRGLAGSTRMTIVTKLDRMVTYQEELSLIKCPWSRDLARSYDKLWKLFIWTHWTGCLLFLVGDPLVIPINCMSFGSPFLDFMRISFLYCLIVLHWMNINISRQVRKVFAEMMARLPFNMTHQ